jgi:uncharacterized membrane protein YesL
VPGQNYRPRLMTVRSALKQVLEKRSILFLILILFLISIHLTPFFGVSCLSIISAQVLTQGLNSVKPTL